MQNQTLVNETHALHQAFLIQLNNSYIFLDQSKPLLSQARKALKNDEKGVRTPYTVPSQKEYDSEVKRSAIQIRGIYSQYLKSGLYEAFLITAVAQFEAFLADFMVTFLRHNPMRSNETVPGIAGVKTFDADVALNATTLEGVLKGIFEAHADRVFRESPEKYLAYMRKLVGVNSEQGAMEFCEVSATRDLLVHAKLVVNQQYLSKAGNLKRAEKGNKITVDAEYYAEALRSMKRIAQDLRDAVKNKFED